MKQTNKYTKVAAHALIEKDGKYLVTRRAKSDDYMPGYWDMPGGTIEFGEDILDALEREIGEEIRLKVKIGKPVAVYNFLSNGDRHQFMVTFACEYVSGEPSLSMDHDEYRWVSLEELAKLKKIEFLKQLYLELKKN